jgi:hypothetical protein
MQPTWPWWKWVLAGGGALAAVTLLVALFLALTGRPDQWITAALAGAIIVVVVWQLVRRTPPDATSSRNSDAETAIYETHVRVDPGGRRPRRRAVHVHPCRGRPRSWSPGRSSGIVRLWKGVEDLLPDPRASPARPTAEDLQRALRSSLRAWRVRKDLANVRLPAGSLRPLTPQSGHRSLVCVARPVLDPVN